MESAAPKRHFTAADGPQIGIDGGAFKKKPNPVYMVQQLADFEVETEEGLMQGHSGDYVCYDPISEHVWPITEEYFELHYEQALV